MAAIHELLEVGFIPTQDGQFFVNVESGSGQASVESRLPFYETPNRWRTTLIKVLEANRFRSSDFSDDEQQWMVQEGILDGDRHSFRASALKTIGQQIYNALFPTGRVRNVLNRALARAEEHHRQLHIQLKFSSDIVEVTRIPDYPWELAHDGTRFLAHYQVRFSRFIAYDETTPRLPQQESLRVLLISSRASDQDRGLLPLSDDEQRALFKGIGKAQQDGFVDIEILEHATQNQLRAYLTEHSGVQIPHIIHFDGHGVFGRRCNGDGTIHTNLKDISCKQCGNDLPDPQGYLVFEAEDGGVDYVSAQELGVLLQKSSFHDSSQSVGVTLVVLSACKSGLSLGSNSVFNGVAQRLISHRIPAVMAMQYTVRVDSAKLFAEQFYRSLGQKNSLATAVSQGQEAMGAEGNQWYRPVLYLRWQDNEGGQLFAPPKTSLPSPLPLDEETNAPLLPDVSLGTFHEPTLQQRVKDAFSIKTWSPSRKRTAIFSCFVAVGWVLARMLGLMEGTELYLYDQFLRNRPPEDIDDRILVIEITQSDFSTIKATGYTNLLGHNCILGSGSLPDCIYNELLEKLEPYKPKVIGLDIYRANNQDIGFEAAPDSPILKKYLEGNTEIPLFTVCKASIPEENRPGIDPPPESPNHLIGFSDFVGGLESNQERITRRHLMWMNVESPSDSQITNPCETNYAFNMAIATYYLGIEPQIDEFKEHKILNLTNEISVPRIHSWSGGYQNIDIDGYQTLLNYRSARKWISDDSASPHYAVNRMSILDALRNEDNRLENFVPGRIILIGRTDEASGDLWRTPYDQGFMPGVILHAQMISQVLSAVEDNRSFLTSWSEWQEYLWILLWFGVGCFCLTLFFIASRRSILLLSLAFSFSGLFIICLFFFWGRSTWIPFFPCFLMLITPIAVGYVVYTQFDFENKTLK